jgi:hypothetical protein
MISLNRVICETFLLDAESAPCAADFSKRKTFNNNDLGDFFPGDVFFVKKSLAEFVGDP